MPPEPTTLQRRALAVATLVSLAVLYYLLRPFAGTLIAAGVAAYVLAPVYRSACRRLRWPQMALPVTWIVGLVGFLIPFGVIAWMTAHQVGDLVEQASVVVGAEGLNATGDRLLAELGDALEEYVGDDVAAVTSQLSDLMATIVRSGAERVLSFGSQLIGSFPGILTNAIVFFYVVSGLVTSHGRLLDLLERINPLGKRATDTYVEKADAMTAAMIRGQFVIAVVQGLTSALSLQLVGIDYFAFFLLLLSFLSLIPLGAGIVTIPIGVVLMLTGNPVGGLVVILTHLLVVTNIDNVLRPRLVPREAALSPALTMVSVLSGVALFGFFGIVVGPVLTILAVTTVETYADVVTADRAAAAAGEAAEAARRT